MNNSDKNQLSISLESQNNINKFLKEEDYESTKKGIWEVERKWVFQRNIENMRDMASFYHKIGESLEALSIMDNIIRGGFCTEGDAKSFIYIIRFYLKRNFKIKKDFNFEHSDEFKEKFEKYKESILITCEVIEKNSFSVSHEKAIVNFLKEWVKDW